MASSIDRSLANMHNRSRGPAIAASVPSSKLRKQSRISVLAQVTRAPSGERSPISTSLCAARSTIVRSGSSPSNGGFPPNSPATPTTTPAATHATISSRPVGERDSQRSPASGPLTVASSRRKRIGAPPGNPVNALSSHDASTSPTSASVPYTSPRSPTWPSRPTPLRPAGAART
jgi:hypothetical protein